MRAARLALLPSLLVAQTLGAQSPADSSAPKSPAPLGRYVIDAATLVREGGARSITDVLISRVPGLLVIPGSGLTGGGARIRFAGVRSLVDDGPPLILVDGMRVDVEEDASLISLGGPGPFRLDDLPVEDLESIEVFRGPASGAIYGPGADAGVILITTKRGHAGRLALEGHTQAALRGAPAAWPANYGGVDADNPNARMRQGHCSLLAQAYGMCVQDFVQRFNPLVERSPFATPLSRQAGLAASGGSEVAAFRLAGGFDGDAAAYDVPAVGWNDDYRRWNVRGSGVSEPLSGLTIAANLAHVSSDLRLPLYGPIQAALLGPSDTTGFAWTPMFASRGRQAVRRNSGTVDVRARPVRWLELRGVGGIEDVDQRDDARSGPSSLDGHREAGHRSIHLTASAANIALGSMRFTTTAGLERLTNQQRSAGRVTLDDTTGCNQFPGGCLSQTFASFRRLRSTGLYLSEQVALSDRLLVTGVIRHDGFRGFPESGQTNPAVAVDWIARPAGSGPLGRLAVRAAYGSATRPPPTDLAFSFVVLPGPPVERLRLEQTRAFEVGADAELMNGRWHAQSTLYDLRSDVIAYARVPGGFGLVTAYFNGAAISNRGVAATLSGTVVDNAKLSWDLRLSFWGNRNRLVKFTGPQGFRSSGGTLSANRDVVDHPVGGYWGRPIVAYADTNADGILTTSEVSGGLMAPAGIPYPTQGAALTSTWRFASRWHLSTTLDYRAGQTLFNETAYLRCLYGTCREVNDPATPLATQANVVAGFSFPGPTYFENADYLKLREIALVFDLPQRTAAAFGARAATITVAGWDLLTLTGYTGADPESGSYGRPARGLPPTISDYATVPVTPSWALHVRLTY